MRQWKFRAVNAYLFFDCFKKQCNNKNHWDRALWVHSWMNILKEYLSKSWLSKPLLTIQWKCQTLISWSYLSTSIHPIQTFTCSPCSRSFIFWPLYTNQALLLVEIVFKFQACSLNINLFPNYKPIAMTLISELWPNMSLNSIELTLLEAFLWGRRHSIFSFLNYWGNTYHWRINSKGWQYSTTRRLHTTGSHNNDKFIAA